MNSIAGSLTINGNEPTSGSDWLYIDDSGDTLGNTGTLTSTTITGLGMAGSITYGTVEHVVITLGSGGDTFTIESTHTRRDGAEHQRRQRHRQCQVDQRGRRRSTAATTSDTFNVGSTAPVTVDSIGAASDDQRRRQQRHRRRAERQRHGRQQQQHRHADGDDDQRPGYERSASPTAPSST